MFSYLKLLVLTGLLLSFLAFLSLPNLIAGQKAFGATSKPATVQAVDVLTSPCANGHESGLPAAQYVSAEQASRVSGPGENVPDQRHVSKHALV